MKRRVFGGLVLLGVLTATGSSACSQEPPARAAVPALAGMWSGVLNGAVEDMFCDWGWCTDVGRERLAALLDDPANDDRFTMLLFGEAAHYQLEHYVIPRLTPAGRAALGVDPADDPGFLLCEPWGFARQIFAPHQLQITQLDDRVEMHYGTWDARRTIWLDLNKAQRSTTPVPSRLGFSVGYYDAETLVVETSGIAANFAPWGWDWSSRFIDGKHSGELRAIERYSRSEDGDRLLLTVTLDDPWSMSEPLVLKRVWSAAPDEQIYPDEDCERPRDFIKGSTAR